MRDVTGNSHGSPARVLLLAIAAACVATASYGAALLRPIAPAERLLAGVGLEMLQPATRGSEPASLVLLAVGFMLLARQIRRP